MYRQLLKGSSFAEQLTGSSPKQYTEEHGPPSSCCRINFVNVVYTYTKDGMDFLGVEAPDLDRPKPAMIATSVVYLTILVIVTLLSFIRSFIEAAHDATGGGSQGLLPMEGGRSWAQGKGGCGGLFAEDGAC